MMQADTAICRGLSLRGLLEGLTQEAVPDLNPGALSQTAQEIGPGGLFLASAGESGHGLDYLEQAVARGAVAVAWEPVPGRAAPDRAPVPMIPVPNLRQVSGLIADRFFGEPSSHMRIAGITGTNGKTSCTFFVAGAMERLRRPCAVMGTLGSGRPGQLEQAELTTPDAVSVHRNLARLLSRDVANVAMEVSSHALVQGRTSGVRFSSAVFTNLSRDHLDYHGDLESYGEAKRSLFARPELGTAIVNRDDPWGRRIIESLSPRLRSIQVSLGPVPGADHEWLAASEVRARRSGIAFEVSGSFGHGRIESRLVGEFNVVNLLLSLGVLLSWDIEFDSALAALGRVKAPAGRMETFGSDCHAPLVIVDYAHTPDALEHVLRAARAHARGKLTVVFGCGGQRDRGKRPEMGEIAGRLADQVIVTDDNPRDEDPDAIVAEILSGIDGPAHVERDRAVAIAGAIRDAGEGDVVVIAGKGHEIYQTTAAGRQPFSDREVVAGILSRRTEGGAA